MLYMLCLSLFYTYFLYAYYRTRVCVVLFIQTTVSAASRILFCFSPELLNKKKKAPGLALKKKFKKNSDFWVYEKKVRFIIRKTIKKQWFYWFVIMLVFFNTCSVAVEHYGQPDWLSEFLRKLSRSSIITLAIKKLPPFYS